MPHQIRTCRLPFRARVAGVIVAALLQAAFSPSRTGVHVALMTRARRAAIAPVVSQPPATDSTHRLAQGSTAPLGEVVMLSATRDCDDQPAGRPRGGGAAATNPTN